ncbi:MAG: ABC transporter transmembrane domain-containing protein [Cyanobacteria bacterium J06621_12]
MDLNTVDITKISSTAFAENSKATNVALLYLLQQQQFSPTQTELVTSLSQNFEVLEVKLGEELATYSGTLNNSLSQDFFLVCEGRLRLLGFDVDKQREVSTNVISEGAICGGECLGTENALPYRLIAASDSRIAKITAAKLKSGLEKLPELKQKWQIETQQYQKLIFFKTLTELRSLASHRLKQLLPYLVEQKVKARAQIDTEGCTRFWLREGQFEGQAVSIGDSKTCSAAAAWVAQTNLTIYQLPQKNWQVFAELAPELATAWSTDSRLQSEEKMTVKSNHREVNALANINHTSVALSYHADPDNSQETANQQPQKVDYPQPIKRRRVLWRTYPYIEQQSSSDCGAACLAMISRYWGKRVSINYLRKLIGIGRSGSSLKSMAKAAESLGYHARPVRASLSRIVQQQNPWIAHWEGDHYVVVYRLKGDRLLVADPASGIRQIGRTEFLAGWTGYALLLDPTENLYQAPTEKRSLSRFFYLLLPYRSLGVTIILASVLIQILGVISPLFTQIILDRVVVNRSQSTLNVLIIGMLMFGALNIGLSSVRSYLLSYLANRLDLTMIGGFVNHALNLPLKFFESRRVGDIITRVQENQKIQQFLIQNVMLSWLDFLTGFVYLGLMLYYNWQLTVLILLLIPPIVILTLAATPLLRKVSRQRFNATADQNSSLVEMMTGISTVKAVTAEQDLRWRWEDLLTRQLNVQFKGQKLAINLGLLSGLINSIGGGMLLWYGATLVIQGNLTIGQYVAFNMMKGHIISPVMVLVGLWDELQEVLISVERLNDVFDSKPEESAQEPKLVLPKLKGDIVLDNVTFRYDDHEEINILQNISLEITAGQTVAIVGRSGSGKSTLVKLIQGLYYPTSGQILVDGHNLKHVSLKSLRSQMGVVPQNCFLFSGTILDNITLYRPEYTLEQAIATAKLAEAHAFIQAMPLGYNTKVGERGESLSGGQRQRIAIARAFLGDPAILILDEATSSLDTESERRFQDNLLRRANQQTTLIIAHRLSTVREADSIIVLDRGIIVEQGNHQELIAQQGLYYQLAQQQLSL